MRIDIISAVPDSLTSYLNASILKRAQDKNKIEFCVHNLRDYTHDKHRQIDDKPFGGGPGMVLKPEPFFECIELLLSKNSYDEIIFLAPQGNVLNQSIANRLSLCENIILIAGHYKGIDDRVREKFATMEISIGNFVLSGGELPALVLVDSVVRLIPGVLNDSESALQDSFMDGDNISSPYFTRPADYRGMKVPDVLLSGHDKKIEDWKSEQSKSLTKNWIKNNRGVDNG